MTKTAKVGDNSGAVQPERLKAFIERIERLEEEKAALTEDVKAVYAEAKAAGLSTKIMRKVVKIRAEDENKRREEDEMLDLYLSALGIF